MEAFSCCAQEKTFLSPHPGSQRQRRRSDRGKSKPRNREQDKEAKQQQPRRRSDRRGTSDSSRDREQNKGETKQEEVGPVITHPPRDREQDESASTDSMSTEESDSSLNRERDESASADSLSTEGCNEASDWLGSNLPLAILGLGALVLLPTIGGVILCCCCCRCCLSTTSSGEGDAATAKGTVPLLETQALCGTDGGGRWRMDMEPSCAVSGTAIHLEKEGE